MDYEISLRRSEASLVEVITPEEANQLENRRGKKKQTKCRKLENRGRRLYRESAYPK